MQCTAATASGIGYGFSGNTVGEPKMMSSSDSLRRISRSKKSE